MQMFSISPNLIIGNIISITGLMSVLFFSNAQAVESQTVDTTIAPNNVLLYISPNNFQQSTRLLHPYYDYWFAQGPLVESIALKALQDKVSDVSVCKANETANTIVRLSPSLFYNPQMRVYHGKLTATVYAGNGNLLGTYVGEAQQQGFASVDVGTNSHIQKVYALAMQDLMRKINLNTAVADASSHALPCGLIAAQVQPTVNFY